MPEQYRRSFTVRWGEVDTLGHMGNVAYLDKCVDVRFGYFASQGVKAGELLAGGVGPVVRRDEVDYFRELKFQERYDVDLCLAGISPDGSRFRLRNVFYRADGKRAARVVSSGGWLDLAQRRLVAAPEPILRALLALPRTEDYADLESSLRPNR